MKRFARHLLKASPLIGGMAAMQGWGLSPLRAMVCGLAVMAGTFLIAWGKD